MVRGSAVAISTISPRWRTRMRPLSAAVIAIETAHQRRLAGAGRSGQHDALARMHGQSHVGQHRNAHAATQMQREAFGQSLGAQHHRTHRVILRPETISSDFARIVGRCRRQCTQSYCRLMSPEGRNHVSRCANAWSRRARMSRAWCPVARARAAIGEVTMRIRVVMEIRWGKRRIRITINDPPLTHRGAGGWREPSPGNPEN